jgi:hypothetical protein
MTEIYDSSVCSVDFSGRLKRPRRDGSVKESTVLYVRLTYCTYTFSVWPKAIRKPMVNERDTYSS